MIDLSVSEASPRRVPRRRVASHWMWPPRRDVVVREVELQREFLDRNSIRFGDELLPTYPTAFLLTGEQRNRWQATTNRFAAAIEEVAGELKRDSSLGRRLNLSAEAWDLLEIDRGYSVFAPIARPDAVPVGEDISLIEYNADSPAMMAFHDALAEHFLETRSDFAGVAPNCTRALLKTLLECNQEFGGPQCPTIAIVDWPGVKTLGEQELLARRFEALGVPSLVCDPRALDYRNGRLEHEGRHIHLVYRRALFSEIVARADELSGLLQAYRAGKVCVVNPLSSHLAGCKLLLSVISQRSETFGDDLLPETVEVTDETREPISTGGSWVLKRNEGHGGQHVCLPDDRTAWLKAMGRTQQECWIAQRMLELPLAAFADLEHTRSRGASGPLVWAPKFWNWNPFIFGGKCSGAIVRVGRSPLVSISGGGGVVPCFHYATEGQGDD